MQVLGTTRTRCQRNRLHILARDQLLPSAIPLCEQNYPRQPFFYSPYIVSGCHHEGVAVEGSTCAKRLSRCESASVIFYISVTIVYNGKLKLLI